MSEITEKVKQFTPYRQIAFNAFLNWGIKEGDKELKDKELEERAYEYVTKLSYKDLENKVWAENSINSALEQIAKLEDIDLDQLKNAVFGDNNLYATNDSREFLKNLNNLDVRSTLSILDNIHIKWVKDNFAKKFNHQDRQDKRYQHLPTEMIGWKETSADLVFVQPILEAMGMEVNNQDLENGYNAWAIQFAMDKGLLNENLQVDNKAMQEYVKSSLEKANEKTGANLEIDSKAILDTVRQAKNKQDFDSIKEFEVFKDRIADKDNSEKLIESHTALLDAKQSEYSLLKEKGLEEKGLHNSDWNEFNTFKNVSSSILEKTGEMYGYIWEGIHESLSFGDEFTVLGLVLDAISALIKIPLSTAAILIGIPLIGIGLGVKAIARKIVSIPSKIIKHRKMKKMMKINKSKNFDEMKEQLLKEIKEAEEQISKLKETTKISESDIISAMYKYQNKKLNKEDLIQQNTQNKEQTEIEI